jgi:glycosyltransferase involved in cell wall biosynthesis
MVRLRAVLELSVVIPTYNRRERLARVLAALGRQTAGPERFEVVVVDDGSSDGTSEWLARQRPAFGLRALRLTNGGPARARNAGIEAAQGQIILFIDDDVEPIPELLQEHLSSHREADNLVVIGPLASLPHYAQPWVAWEQAKVEAQYAAMTRGDWAPTFRQFWTGNASLQKRHLLAAGSFDPTYLRAEDVELGLRLQGLGLDFRFNHRARGMHYAERSLSSWENVCRSYGYNDVTIFGKLGDPHMLSILTASWRNLNPAVRFVVTSCLNHPVRHGVMRSLLRAQLRLAERVALPTVSEPVCSVLASLLYWQAASDQLGPERARKVFQRA